MKPYRFLAVIAISAYAIIGIATLSSYGVNWDEANHSTRGQAYLHYFLTGRKSYDPAMYEPDKRMSFYQIPGFDFSYQMLKDGDHPVLSDILSSLSNLIFYQKLGILGDFEAYHVYGVLLVTIFLIFLYWWVEQFFGGFAGLVSVLSLIVYPLFYGESHFNVQKDIPEAVFFIATALTFGVAYTRTSSRWMIVTGILGGLALGTKLNIVFLLPVLVLWLILKERKNFFDRLRRLPSTFIISFFTAPIIAFLIFYASWPWLWQRPVQKLLQVLGYYHQMGIVSTSALPARYYILGVNTYAIQWILFTTPLVILFLSAVGIVVTILRGWKEKQRISLYVLFLFLLPIARVSLPFTSIYGGARQIMEYIPAMAILAGVGANYLVKLLHGYIVALRKRNIIHFSSITIKRLGVVMKIMITLSFLPIAFKIAKMYPNESVYFNPLIGGLKGAAERNIPGWGNSLGSTYRQGVRWINEHAEKGAKVALAFELMSALPRSEFRPDILFSNTYRSGPKRESEYIIGVTHEGIGPKYLNYRYAERFLEPVYTVEVEGVPVLKVWKNDKEHTRPKFLTDGFEITGIHSEVVGSTLVVEFPNVVRLLEMEILFNELECELPREGHLFLSLDGYSWSEPFTGTILESASYNWLKHYIEKGKLFYFFAADEAKFMRITKNRGTSCLRKLPVSIRVKAVEK